MTASLYQDVAAGDGTVPLLQTQNSPVVKWLALSTYHHYKVGLQAGTPVVVALFSCSRATGAETLVTACGFGEFGFDDITGKERMLKELCDLVTLSDGVRRPDSPSTR